MQVARTAGRGRGIQWKVAVESTASTGSSSIELEQVGLAHVDPGRQQLARLLDHRRRGVDGDHAAARQPLEQQPRHVAGPAAGVEHRLVAGEDEPVEHVAAHRGERRGDPLVGRGVPVARWHTIRTLSRTEDERLGLVARALDELAHLAGALAPLAEHVRRRRCSGSVVSGRPTPMRTRWKSAAAELALERLEAVVAGEPAAEPHADVAERQVDLVVDRRARRSRSSLKEPRAGPTERPASFM